MKAKNSSYYEIPWYIPYSLRQDLIFLSLRLNDPNTVIMDACNFFPSFCSILNLNHNAELVTSLSIISTWLHLQDQKEGEALLCQQKTDLGDGR